MMSFFLFLGLDATCMHQGAFLGNGTYMPTQGVVSSGSSIPNTEQVFMSAESQYYNFKSMGRIAISSFQGNLAIHTSLREVELPPVA